MGYWANTTSQTIGATSGAPVTINFDFEVTPGEQTVSQGGIYAYSYTLNLAKPDGELAPTRVGSTLGIKPQGQPVEEQVYAASFGVIESQSRLLLANHGELSLQADDKVVVGVAVFETHGDFSISTIAQRCTFQLTKLT
jgi:hypothetical protein